MAIKCFYAYASSPAIVGEVIRDAVEQNNVSNPNIQILEWRNMNPSGKLIPEEVCREIDDADLVICDLTTINENVLFEFGYAMARNKRIWITSYSNPHDSNSQIHNKKIEMLTTLGYVGYSNAFDLINKFHQQKPYEDLEDTIIKDHLSNLDSNEKSEDFLFYLKSSMNDSASQKMTSELRKLHLPLILDDPLEVQGQTLAWYAEKVCLASGVVVHFVDPNIDDAQDINARYALVCGLTKGFEKYLGIFFDSSHGKIPMDYRDLTNKYESSQECVTLLQSWLQNWRISLSSRHSDRLRTKQYRHAQSKLRRIKIGEYMAENEKNTLRNYFIETTGFEKAKTTSEYLLFIGRKGTGKTANLFQLADILNEDKRNHICIIKPHDYQLEDVYHLFQISNDNPNQNYLVQSLWKYLIYTELARSVYDKIDNREAHFQNTDSEDKLVEFIESYDSIIDSDFSSRMSKTIKELGGIDLYNASPDSKDKISEILHSNILAKMRNLLGEVLSNKQKVVVLIDNLDKNWTKRDDIETLSKFLFGMLNVTNDIIVDFTKTGLNKTKIQLSLVIFMRSDIYSHISLQAREPDKLQVSYISWDDRELLQRVIEDRFIDSLSVDKLPQQIWDEYFVKTVNDKITKEYLLDRIIPRPRDIIYFVKSALATAVNRGHEIIEESDIKYAEKDYSHHAYLSLLAEIRAIIDRAEDVLYTFIGESEFISHGELLNLLDGYTGNTNKNDIIDRLVDNVFLGLETHENEFTFLYDEKRKQIIRKQAEKFAADEMSKRYKINLPFHAHLDIKTE